MSDKSLIEWTDATWNPIRGCSRVSEGCRHCYAEGVAARFSGPGLPYEGLAKRVTRPDGSTEARWTGKMARAPEETLTQPLRWKKPRRIFVNSMSDLFHESVPDEWIDRIFAVMALCPQHTFQVLTKRPERMKAYMLERWQPALARRVDFGRGDALDIPAENVGEGRRDQVARECEDFIRQFKLDDTKNEALWDEEERLKIMQWAWPLPNVWLGTSVEDQVTADVRIEYLRRTPSVVRFISFEPLLGAIEANLEDIHWAIVGGESGLGARPMHPEWARGLRDQCAAARVAFFFKQWGEWHPSNEHDERATGCTATPDAIHVGGERELRPAEASSLILTQPGWAGMCRLGKKRAGRLLDGVRHNALPASEGQR